MEGMEAEGMGNPPRGFVLRQSLAKASCATCREPKPGPGTDPGEEGGMERQLIARAVGVAEAGAGQPGRRVAGRAVAGQVVPHAFQ